MINELQIFIAFVIKFYIAMAVLLSGAHALRPSWRIGDFATGFAGVKLNFSTSRFAPGTHQ
jgi:hypothetical protein